MKYPIPNVAATTQNAQDATMILGLVTGMGLVRFLAKLQTQTAGPHGQPGAVTTDVRGALNQTPILPLIGVGITLVILSDFDAVRDIVRVFTLLAFITALLLNGEAAFATLQRLSNRRIKFQPYEKSPLGKSIKARKETT